MQVQMHGDRYKLLYRQALMNAEYLHFRVYMVEQGGQSILHSSRRLNKQLQLGFHKVGRSHLLSAVGCKGTAWGGAWVGGGCKGAGHQA